MHEPLPPIPPVVVNGMFTMGAAAVSGLVSWWGGDRGGNKRGRIEGETRFINAVHDAAALVIDGLSQQHEECKAQLALVNQQIDDIMNGRVPIYHVNKNSMDPP